MAASGGDPGTSASGRKRQRNENASEEEDKEDEPTATEEPPPDEERSTEEEDDDAPIETDEDDDPVELLVAQGVSEEVARRALENADGDVDEAVMEVIRLRELEEEERDMAKGMEESLREAEEEATKREAELAEKKRTAPAEYFAGSSFLSHLGVDASERLLREESSSRDDVMQLLDFERQCKKWYRGNGKEVDSKFAAIAAEIVANLPHVDAAKEESGETDMLHSLIVAHLMTLREAVLAHVPEKSGSVPEIFSPTKTADEIEEVDLCDSD